MDSSISVIVPVYNGELTLPELVNRLHSVLEALGVENELIMVNDGSDDRSWDVICQLVAQNNWIRGINLMRNYGQHNALLAGIHSAGYELIVTIDDDLQHPPEEIPKLLKKLAEGYDVVYGNPRLGHHSFWRKIASWIIRLSLYSIFGYEIARKVSAFRVFRTQIRDAFKNYESPFISIDVLLTWGTKKFSSVSVQHDPRRRGQSNYTFLRLISHALDMVTGFSTMPLKFASIFGFIFSVFGFGVLVFVIGRYLILGSSVAGFPFLASIIAIFSGAQLFALGVIGEYLARIHFRSMRRPAYTVRSTADNKKQDPPKN